MNHSEPQTLIVSDSQADHCLDKYICSQVKGVLATVLFRLMRTKQITVNGANCKPDQRTVAGDKVRLPALEVAAEKPTPTGDRKAAEQLARRLSRHIVFEDSDMLVVNKPANIAVHVGSGVKAGVIEALRVLRPKEKELELAHRLDKETSGFADGSQELEDAAASSGAPAYRRGGHPALLPGGGFRWSEKDR
ncbi:pseudouridine synthase [Corynebacterium sp. YSMAA1_1_F7]|uniref:pseudouridine synthase n=1 Tax=Corynebacterium sp. YSMAA1_1_F7 TaxID=3383590 RepID=UPI0038CF3936